MDVDMIPKDQIGSFAEVHGLYMRVSNIPRSTLSMRMTRAAENPRAHDLPRPFTYVANGQVPLYDMREVRAMLGIVEGGVKKSEEGKQSSAKAKS